MRFVVCALSAVVIAGCGLLGGAGIAVPVEDKDFVTDAKGAIVQLKADYVLTKGIGAVVQQKIDEFLYIEDGLKLGRVKWKDFRSELDACWNAPLETVAKVEQRAVKAVDAAQQFKNRTTLHEVRAVQDTTWNAVQKVRACPQSLTDKVKGMPRRASDEAKAWAQGKFQILNDLRVLLKSELPTRVKALPTNAVSNVGVVAKQLASAQTWQATLNKMGKSAANQAKTNQAQVKQLQGIQKQANGLKDEVVKDASQLSTQAVELGVKVTDGINGFKN